MYDAQSTYVKEQLRGAPYTERRHVKRLLAIERYARLGRVTGWIHGMMIEHLWRENNTAFRAILSELNPALLRERARDEEERHLDARRSRYDALEREQRDREAWVRAGGAASVDLN